MSQNAMDESIDDTSSSLFLSTSSSTTFSSSPPSSPATKPTIKGNRGRPKKNKGQPGRPKKKQDGETKSQPSGKRPGRKPKSQQVIKTNNNPDQPITLSPKPSVKKRGPKSKSEKLLLLNNINNNQLQLTSSSTSSSSFGNTSNMPLTFLSNVVSSNPPDDDCETIQSLPSKLRECFMLNRYPLKSELMEDERNVCNWCGGAFPIHSLTTLNFSYASMILHWKMNSSKNNLPMCLSKYLCDSCQGDPEFCSFQSKASIFPSCVTSPNGNPSFSFSSDNTVQQETDSPSSLLSDFSPTKTIFFIFSEANEVDPSELIHVKKSDYTFCDQLFVKDKKYLKIFQPLFRKNAAKQAELGGDYLFSITELNANVLYQVLMIAGLIKDVPFAMKIKACEINICMVSLSSFLELLTSSNAPSLPNVDPNMAIPIHISSSSSSSFNVQLSFDNSQLLKNLANPNRMVICASILWLMGDKFTNQRLTPMGRKKIVLKCLKTFNLSLYPPLESDETYESKSFTYENFKQGNMMLKTNWIKNLKPSMTDQEIHESLIGAETGMHFPGRFVLKGGSSYGAMSVLYIYIESTTNESNCREFSILWKDGRVEGYQYSPEQHSLAYFVRKLSEHPTLPQTEVGLQSFQEGLQTNEYRFYLIAEQTHPETNEINKLKWKVAYMLPTSCDQDGNVFATVHFPKTFNNEAEKACHELVKKLRDPEGEYAVYMYRAIQFGLRAFRVDCGYSNGIAYLNEFAPCPHALLFVEASNNYSLLESVAWGVVNSIVSRF
jgi:hypothetical protein